MNNDRWSWLINNECNIMIDNERLYEEINEYYEKLKKMSKEVKKYYRINASQAAYINFWQWFLHLSEIVMRKN
jgi:phosphatidylserine/phosphatidylglycerophosphate/cardiolipin synthase-like enzyme